MTPLVLSEQDPASAPWWLLGVAVVLLLAFVAWERRARRTHGHPLVNFGLLRTRSYALGTSLGLLYFAGFTAIFFVVTLFLQNGRGYTPLEAGLALTPFALGSAVTSAIGGRLVSRLGKSLVVLGLLAVAVGLVAVDVVLRLDPQQVGWAIAGPLLLAGIGSGFVIAPNQTLALEEVPPREGGTAAGVLQTGQRIGSAIGISAVGAVFFGQLTATGGDWSLAISRGLIGAVAFVVLALLLGLADLALDRRRRRAAAGARRSRRRTTGPHPRPAPPRRGRRVDPAGPGHRPAGGRARRCDGDARGRRRPRGGRRRGGRGRDLPPRAARGGHVPAGRPGRRSPARGGLGRGPGVRRGRPRRRAGQHGRSAAD